MNMNNNHTNLHFTTHTIIPITYYDISHSVIFSYNDYKGSFISFFDDNNGTCKIISDKRIQSSHLPHSSLSLFIETTTFEDLLIEKGYTEYLNLCNNHHHDQKESLLLQLLSFSKISFTFLCIDLYSLYRVSPEFSLLLTDGLFVGNYHQIELHVLFESTDGTSNIFLSKNKYSYIYNKNVVVTFTLKGMNKI
jgi:hypothetical protein